MKWPTTNAKVTGSERTSFACEVARISFSYKVADILYEGKQVVPFWSRNSAEQYVRFREPGTTVMVRVNPEDPGKSFLLDRVVSPGAGR
ncbi:DUF3592 domain-containing protein [Edaphobacter sp.]|uniref:DUF3592 domain-containing protein n=1 Tax=Edaphobacter sp. TaxID=1934404 RepID=UPI003BB929E5